MFLIRHFVTYDVYHVTRLARAVELWVPEFECVGYGVLRARAVFKFDVIEFGVFQFGTIEFHVIKFGVIEFSVTKFDAKDRICNERM